jgi:hypothetical protein
MLLQWAAPLAWLGCGGGGGTDVVLPSLSVTTSTTGVELDADGYSLIIDDTPGQPIGLAATLTIERLTDGAHSIGLTGLAPNCAAADNPRTVTIRAGATASVSFVVTCSATSGTIEVATTTSGSGSDPDGFALILDGSEHGPIGVTATAMVNGLVPGTHTVGLAGLAANCQVVGENPRSVTVIPGQTTQASFAVTCATPTPGAGTLEITTSTTGSDQDPNGYRVRVDGGPPQPIGLSGTIALSNISPAQHTVELLDIATNCTISGSNRRTVTVTSGQTTNVAFAIACVAASPTLNLRIERMYITQSTQTLTGGVPLVQGREGYIRVFVTASGSNTAQPGVRVRFFRNGASAPVRTFTIAAPGSSAPTSVQEGTLGSSWNVRVPGSVIQSNTSVVAELDPDNSVAETNENDNRFPASGTQSLTVQSVPPVRIRFIPIQQGGNPPGNVTNANKDRLMELARRMHPLSAIDADVDATVFPASAPLDFDGTGWGQLLSDLEGKRVTEGTDRIYFGIVRLGYGRGGLLGLTLGQGIPTAVGWDDASDASRVVAHELGHVWDQLHSPCANPPDVDPGYPYGSGIGVYGLDVGAGSLKPPSLPDIMGYCANPWISDYTYRRILDFRATQAATAGPVLAQTQSAVLVWGRIENGRPVLEPAFHIVTRPKLPTGPGPYSVTASAVDGGRLFTLSFDAAAAVDDPKGTRFFTFAVPLDPTRVARLATLQLTTPGGQTAISSQSTARAQEATSGGVVARRRPGGMTLQWNASAHPMIMVRDRHTGKVLSFARGGNARVWTARGEVDLEVSDGVRSHRARLAISRP